MGSFRLPLAFLSALATSGLLWPDVAPAPLIQKSPRSDSQPVLEEPVTSAPPENRGVRIQGKDAARYVAEQTGKAWAVVIGIDSYPQKIGSLRYAVADAKAVAQTLKQRGYEVTELYNERATRRAIESELRTRLPRKVGEQDRVLIFYAGHGQDETVKGGKPMGYLLPADGEKDDIPATGVSMGTVRELADALPAKHVLFLLDVCFGGIAGTLTRGSPQAVTDAYLKQITRERGRHLITAGAADQEVIESAQWGHSVFTYFLLKGLNEGLADQDDNGVITAQELYTYLESRVFGEAQQQGHTQTPQMAELSGEKGQFVFFTSATEKRVAPSPTPQISGASSDEMATMKKRLEDMERRLAEQAKAAQPPKPIEETRARPYDQSRQTGREITGQDGAPMVLVPEGEFLYGYNNEKKSLSAFYMDKYEVSTMLYAAFLQSTGREKPARWDEASKGRFADRPVIGVTWHDAESYCRHYGKRLPTEHEWEKAARGADGRNFPWGNEEANGSLAKYRQHITDIWNGYSTLASIESYEAGKSPYGIYNMVGNASEWTSSSTRGDRGESKVIRGGSWTTPTGFLHSTQQDAADASSWYQDRGFRCAQDAK